MKVLVVEPKKKPYPAEIDGSLEAMQAMVGGYIQAVYPFEEYVALICNEEGKLMGLPFNRPLIDLDTGIAYDMIAGTFFLCAVPPESDHFESLSDEQIERYTRYYGGGGSSA